MSAGSVLRARTAPAIIGGILLLVVPFAYLAYEFFLYAATVGTSTLQPGEFITLLKQIGLADLLVFILTPIITAIAAFRREKGFLAVMAFVSAAAWGFDLWICLNASQGGSYAIGFIIQMALWIIAWIFLFIICLVGLKKTQVSIRIFPWVLGLAATVALSIQWFVNLGGFGADIFQGTNIKFVAALTDIAANFILSLGVLMLSLAAGKASAKDTARFAEAKASRTAAKEQEKAAKADAKAKAKQDKKAAKGEKGTSGAPAPVSSVGTGDTVYSFTPAPDSIELSAKGDPFAGALSALDSASEKITLTLDGAISEPAAPAAPSLTTVAVPTAASAPAASQTSTTA